MNITTSTVRSLPGFGNLDFDTLEAVRQISRLVVVPTDAILCRQGGPAENLHYLLDGQVTLTQTASNGDVGLIDVLHPVRGIGLANVLTGDTHPMTAQALAESHLVEIQGAPLRHMMGLRPSLTSTMLQGLSLDLDAVTRQVIDLKLRSAAQRLGCYLLRLAHGVDQNHAAFRLPIRKQLLAAQLGCRHENLSRAFAALRTVGVETHGGRVVLHDIAALRRYAVPDETEQPPPSASASMRSARAFSDAFKLR
jgi:CRP/FNR family transcriptional activator FtrB